MKNIIESYLNTLTEDDKEPKVIEKAEYPPDYDKKVIFGILFANLFFFAMIITGIIAHIINLKHGSEPDDKLTKKMRLITGDPEVNVFVVKKGRPNAFVYISPHNIYYTMSSKKILTEREIIAALLNAYGIARKGMLLKYIISSSLMSVAILDIYIGALSHLLLRKEKIVEYSKDVMKLDSKQIKDIKGKKYDYIFSTSALAMFLSFISKFILKEVFAKKKKYIGKSYAVKKGYEKDLEEALLKIESAAKSDIYQQAGGEKAFWAKLAVAVMSPLAPNADAKLKNIINTKIKPSIKSGKYENLYNVANFLNKMRKGLKLVGKIF